MNRSIARRLALMFALVALFVFTLVGTGLFLVLRTQQTVPRAVYLV